jgi:hypothetical protein
MLVDLPCADDVNRPVWSAIQVCRDRCSINTCSVSRGTHRAQRYAAAGRPADPAAARRPMRYLAMPATIDDPAILTKSAACRIIVRPSPTTADSAFQ